MSDTMLNSAELDKARDLHGKWRYVTDGDLVVFTSLPEKMLAEIERLTRENAELHKRVAQHASVNVLLTGQLQEAREALRWLKPRWNALGGDCIRLDVAKACVDAGAHMTLPRDGWYAAYRARVEAGATEAAQ